jgi:hypothetical protein
MFVVHPVRFPDSNPGFVKADMAAVETNRDTNNTIPRPEFEKSFPISQARLLIKN